MFIAAKIASRFPSHRNKPSHSIYEKNCTNHNFLPSKEKFYIIMSSDNANECKVAYQRKRLSGQKEI